LLGQGPDHVLEGHIRTGLVQSIRPADRGPGREDRGQKGIKTCSANTRLSNFSYS